VRLTKWAAGSSKGRHAEQAMKIECRQAKSITDLASRTPTSAGRQSRHRSSMPAL
jgi:hypothetical protein